ncbi:Lysin A/amidase [Mycolicibacterium canariasense]|uniref:Lysin A/amidase n=1 Tax=Mycolicibacterium canariasense TaxID=228230 RepID=A0A117I991_MYCCR|nr:N-acetylmuramoyl-L-alanine amidase [Mycolicibacterium canariasense]GAS94442.1 Lysin A/amidase [Mycolicibacterium canariasense]
MSFTRFLQDDPLRTRADYMRLFIEVANELGLEEKPAAVLAGMCTLQEVGVKDNDPPFERRIWLPANPTREPTSVNYPHDSESDDGRSVGICQQQRGPNGELWWGTVADEMNPRTAIRNFMSRLPKEFHANDGIDAGHFIAAAKSANDVVQGVQRSGVPEAYAQWWGDAIRLYNEVKAGGPVTVPPPPDAIEYEHGPWTGDPVWLADVLRAEGLTVIETPGWLESGHGDMGSLWGVLNHHTGSNGSTWQSIRYGRSDLAGPLANIHLRRDGVVELVAVGVCWHGGTGYWPGLGRHNANQRMIGIECQNDGGGSPGKPHRSSWPDVQYDALVKVNAAINRRIDVDASHSLSHKEYDQGDPPTAEGKWDPGAIDMDILRADIQAQINRKPRTGGFLMALTDKQQQELYDEIMKRGPSRAALAEDGKDIETMLGFIYNIDGNVWDGRNTLAYLLDVPYAVEHVERVAREGVAPDSYAATNPFVAEFGQDMCKALVAFKPKFQAVFKMGAA